jgi:hypothetical protein
VVTVSKYDNSGTLNPTREKRSDKSPDFYGRVQISGEVLDALIVGKPVRVAGWNKRGPYGEFISLKFELDRPRDEVSNGGNQPQQQGNGFDWKAAEKRERERTAAENVREAMTEAFDDSIPF